MSQGQVQVGVLIAVYAGDDPKLFDRALDSVFGQRLPTSVRLNVYLGVDGPLGPVLERIVLSHAAKCRLVIRNRENRGLALTLNALIQARGDEAFYFRMDADDYSLPDRFQRQLDRMAEDARIDILGTDIEEVDLDTGSRRVVSFLKAPDDLRHFICMRAPVAHPTVCFRRRVFDRVHGYPNATGNEDIAMWFACAQQRLRFDNLRSPLLEFTISDRFWQRRGLRKAWGEFLVYSSGIVTLWGWNWRLVFPLARLLMRVSPGPLARWLYSRRSRHAG